MDPFRFKEKTALGLRPEFIHLLGGKVADFENKIMASDQNARILIFKQSRPPSSHPSF